MLSNKKIFWTTHAKIKMRQYGLSAGKLLQIIQKPQRKERGIASGTTAVMQTRKVYANLKSIATRKKQVPPGEIWLMYKDIKDIRNIISAWRYPGISKPGEAVPIPDDIKQELLSSM